MICEEKTKEPASVRSLPGECLSVTRADDSNINVSINQDSALCKPELDEGLTDFLLKKIIQLRARLQPGSTSSEQAEHKPNCLPVGAAMGMA